MLRGLPNRFGNDVIRQWLVTDDCVILQNELVLFVQFLGISDLPPALLVEVTTIQNGTLIMLKSSKPCYFTGFKALI